MHVEVKKNETYNLDFAEDDLVIMCKLFVQGEAAPCQVELEYIVLE